LPQLLIAKLEKMQHRITSLHTSQHYQNQTVIKSTNAPHHQT